MSLYWHDRVKIRAIIIVKVIKGEKNDKSQNAQLFFTRVQKEKTGKPQCNGEI